MCRGGLKVEGRRIKFMPLAAGTDARKYVWKIGLPAPETHPAQRNDEWQIRSLHRQFNRFSARILPFVNYYVT